MSESGESQPQDDSDEDIYKDFDDFNFGDELAKLESSKETIKKEALDLSEQVKVLTKENEELRKSNEILKKNMSSLLKTAQAEVQRKDSMIQELREKIDSFTFRRKNIRMKDTFTSTQDLEITVKMKNGSAEIKNIIDRKRSKSKESKNNSESERRFCQEEQKKRESEDERENLNCDNNRKFGYYRDSTRRKSRHSDRYYEPYSKKERDFRENSRKSKGDHRGGFSDGHTDHLKYHSLDRRKRSRSSDRRFTYKRRNSPIRRSKRVEEKCEKWRREIKENSSETIKRSRHSGKDKSSSRECSRGKESSFDPFKSRSSSDKDRAGGIKESSNKEPKEPNSVKLNSEESKKESQHLEKEKSEKNRVKTSAKAKRTAKEENSGKSEKPNELDKFNSKSPLDALYNEMITSCRFSKLGSGGSQPEPDIEQAKSAKTAPQKSSLIEEEEEEEEDWTLSFKNERQETVRPMTLYSKRMMQKLSVTKETESLNIDCKTDAEDTKLKEIKKCETEKEPGELTDDENVIESSKEFQELTKVASIDNETIEKPKETEIFKEPMTKEPLNAKNKAEIEPKTEESDSTQEVQREIRDVIEYSPFKNNYKLIEISPIKPSDKEHILELHHKRTSKGQLQKEVESSIFSLLSSLSGVPVASKADAKETKVEDAEKVSDDSDKKSENKEQQSEPFNEKFESKLRSRRNSKSKKTEKKVESAEEESKKKNSEEVIPPGEATQFLDFFLLTTSPSKSVVSGQPETPGKIEKAINLSDPKSDTVNSSTEKIEVENSRVSPKTENVKTEEEKKKTKKMESEKIDQKKQDRSKDDKRVKKASRRESESNCRIQKRKRDSESEPETKKAKLDESPRKRTRSQQNSGTKADKAKAESQPEAKVQVKEDITAFEFFKPIAQKDSPDAAVECKMAAMSVANIVCLETPNKGGTNLKNLMINEQMILNVLDSKSPALCSPLMTPKRLLKNDLMLTDSEDDSGNKGNVEELEGDDVMSDSEDSECESDSGASDFVDLL